MSLIERSNIQRYFLGGSTIRGSTVVNKHSQSQTQNYDVTNELHAEE